MSSYKVVVTVPMKEADELRRAIGQAGGGRQGNYSFCSFSVKGTGRFKPNEGADPTIGEVGTLEEVEEEKIEVVCEKEQVAAVVETIRENHSYEEPVIDVHELIDPDSF